MVLNKYWLILGSARIHIKTSLRKRWLLPSPSTLLVELTLIDIRTNTKKILKKYIKFRKTIPEDSRKKWNHSTMTIEGLLRNSTAVQSNKTHKDPYWGIPVANGSRRLSLPKATAIVIVLNRSIARVQRRRLIERWILWILQDADICFCSSEYFNIKWHISIIFHGNLQMR